MLIKTTEAHNNAPWSMMGPPTLLGLAHDYKNMSDWLDEELIPATASTFRIPETSCFYSYYRFDEKDTGVFFKNGFRAILAPVPHSVIEYGGKFLVLSRVISMQLTEIRVVRLTRASQSPMVLIYGNKIFMWTL
jgi:hypothetical protein